MKFVPLGAADYILMAFPGLISVLWYYVFSWWLKGYLDREDDPPK